MRTNGMTFTKLITVCLFAGVPALALSTGAPAGRTGAPPGTNCTVCHIGTPNSGPGNVRIEFAGGLSTYNPGAVYKVRITLTDPAAQRWGFQVTARKGPANDTLAGSLSIDNATNTQFAPGSGPGEYITHTPTGTFQGTSGSASWEVNWTAPVAGTGKVTFFAAGNAANNNGTNVGDSIYTTSLEVNEASSGVSGSSYVLPQFPYGGGWYVALYFTNYGNAPATMGVDFYNKDGSNLSVPLMGIGPVQSHMATLAPNATLILEAPNSGDLTEGWAKATLPDGVTGYGVFRQSVAGRADQEAVVPLSEDSKTSALFVWDDTAYTTALAVVNPKDEQANGKIDFYDEGGAPIGTLNLQLAGKSRAAYLLRNEPGLAGMTGKRGVARISMTSGSAAALGLRFISEALTSIPVEYP